MTELENPVENACFGCGPANARGLGLRIEHDERAGVVRTTHVPREDESGWPGLVHTGLQYLVLFDLSYWAVLTATGRVHVTQGPQSFDQRRLPRVGKPFHAEARVVAGDVVRTEARSVTDEGKPCATLDAAWVPSRRSTVERAGLALPDYLLDVMEP